MDTADALRSVGNPVAGRLVSNADLVQSNIQVVDCFFPNSQLEDTTGINYVFTG